MLGADPGESGAYARGPTEWALRGLAPCPGGPDNTGAHDSPGEKDDIALIFTRV